MPPWWGKSSSKDAKRKTSKESFIDTLNRKFRSPESKSSNRSGGSRRHSSDAVSEKGSQSRVESRSTSPSKHVARCQSFPERSQAQPLPTPDLLPANVRNTDSGMADVAKPNSKRLSKPSLFRSLPRPACM
ncbi:Mitogen-activated protein kinase kinase kinase YODA [Olea europaea subsp. europaea]|uniref:Mitogen-activated protein kinase kinase kinase YODA n=2 Tax=Olea europaea subsp. europaea TaxID=158383 RepID=A0A8S0PZG3_OLEEU|nr:Mitogen-activated protein kinase kinase kinase YODA [Olea europaea subsp. europaea]